MSSENNNKRGQAVNASTTASSTRRAVRTAAGLCSECGQPYVGKFKRCDACRAKAVAASRHRKEHGQCIICRAPAAGLCDQCRELRRLKYQLRVTGGVCNRCGKPAIAGKSQCVHCLKINKEAAAELRRLRVSHGLCPRCGSSYSGEHRACDHCREKAATHARDLRQAQKALIFDHYGWECACCGEAEPSFLTIDHVNNDGNYQRKKQGEGANGYLYSGLLRTSSRPAFKLCASIAIAVNT